MEVNRKGNQITLSFDTAEEAQGLYAYLTGTVHEIPPEQATKAQWLYTWFFTTIQKLAHNFNTERSVATMTPETLQGLPENTTVSSSKKARKR